MKFSVYVLLGLLTSIFSFNCVTDASLRFCKPCPNFGNCCSERVEDPLDYLLTVPEKLFEGTIQQACLSVFRLNRQMAILATVKFLSYNGSIVYDSSKEVLHYGRRVTCFKLTIPSIAGSKIHLAKLSVELKFYATFQSAPTIFDKTRLLAIHPKRKSVFIDTDKKVYKPGQTVLFRVLQLHTYHPANDTVEKITIIDPRERQLWQTRDRVPKYGLVSDQFKLISEALQGSYKIEVHFAEGIHSYKTSFEVEEYVLPRFEVEVSGPDYLTVLDDTLPVKICAKYTYGKPVHGFVEMAVQFDHFDVTSHREYSETDETGCTYVDWVEQLMDVKGLPRNTRYPAIQLHFTVQVNVTDIVTNSTQSGSFHSKIVSRPYELGILEWDNFPPKYSFKVLYKDIAGSPLADRNILSEVKFSIGGIPMVHTYRASTNRNGYATFEFYLPVRESPSYSVTVRDEDIPTIFNATKPPHLVTSSITKQEMNSPSNYIIMDPVEDLSCNTGYLFTGEMSYLPSESATVPQIVYQAVVYGSLVESGVVEQVICVGDKNVQRCKIAFEVHVGFWNSPSQMLLFFAVGYKIFSDSKILPVDCLQNQVNLQFSKNTALPMEMIGVTLESNPNSLCSLSIVDKSVHLVQNRHQLFSKSSLKSGWEVAESKEIALYIDDDCFRSYLHFVDISEDGIINGPQRNRYKRSTKPDKYVIQKQSRNRRSIVQPDYYAARSDHDDVDEFVMFYGSLKGYFVNAGLVLLTNFHMWSYGCPITYNCIDPFGRRLCEDISEVAFSTAIADGHRTASTIKVRNYFPETWKWKLIETGATGRVQLKAKLPDTITDWIATTYCISHEAGINFADVATVRGFKPMFLSINMPYSVVRGEVVTLRTSLYSYYEQNVCLEMVISLNKSLAFEILNEEVRISRVCVCGQQLVSVDYRVRPLKVGRIKFLVKTWSESGHICGTNTEARPGAIDGVERQLLVESEGIELQETKGDYICLDGDQSKSLVRSFVPPPDHYQDSSILLMNVIGSLMGPALNNLDRLIQRPCGCGEQNMITMVPNLVALRYLQSIGKLSDTMKKEIEANILDGYQRELNYQRLDGSFSAFGNHDSEGSTWLTAFVISTFIQVKKNTDILVDETVLEQAAWFLRQYVDEKGCIEKVGLVHHKDMMGGASGQAALTAYVTMALYTEHQPTDSSVWSFWQSYQSSANDSKCANLEDISTYTKAMKFYTSARKREFSIARLLWDDLEAIAMFDGGDDLSSATACHWTSGQSRDETDQYYYGGTNEIETTGYVLLGFLKMMEDFPGEFPIIQALPIIKWLSSMMNSNGGFSSTQDTVVGFTAVAAFSEATSVDSLNVNVTVTYGRHHADFAVDRRNFLVTQQRLIRQPPKNMTIDIQGSGCVLVQSNFKYNVPEKSPSPSFELSVHIRSTTGGCRNTAFRYLVVCAIYHGTNEQPSSNMAVFEITLVSGYEAVRDSLKKMVTANNANGLKRYEIDHKKISLYFKAIGIERKCAGFEIEQTDKVEDQKPGFVHVYDYYNPQKSATKSFDLNCNWENYHLKGSAVDCLEWNEFGDCHKVCSQRVAVSGKYQCLTVEVQPIAHDICGTIANICNGHGKCINKGDRHECVCDTGYIYHRETCMENVEDERDMAIRTIPECNDDCFPAWIIREGGSERYYCFSGYNLVEHGRQSYCMDIDECTLLSPCHSQLCVNMYSGYDCFCEFGSQYVMDNDEGLVNKSHCVDLRWGYDFTPSIIHPERRPYPSVPIDVPVAVPPVSEVTASVPPVSEVTASVPPVSEVTASVPPVSEVTASVPPVSEVTASVPPVSEVTASAPPVSEVTASVPPVSEVTASVPPVSCARCYSTFPSWSEMKEILCPKRNVYLNKMKNDETVLRAIIVDGQEVNAKSFKFSGTIRYAECPACMALAVNQSIIITSQALTSESRELVLDETVTIIPKRARKRIQNFDCGED